MSARPPAASPREPRAPAAGAAPLCNLVIPRSRSRSSVSLLRTAPRARALSALLRPAATHAVTREQGHHARSPWQSAGAGALTTVWRRRRLLPQRRAACGPARSRSTSVR